MKHVCFLMGVQAADLTKTGEFSDEPTDVHVSPSTSICKLGRNHESFFFYWWSYGLSLHDMFIRTYLPLLNPMLLWLPVHALPMEDCCELVNNLRRKHLRFWWGFVSLGFTGLILVLQRYDSGTFSVAVWFKKAIFHYTECPCLSLCWLFWFFFDGVCWCEDQWSDGTNP